MLRPSQPRRDGSMLPLMAVSAISLFAFVALAVDIGMLAVSRTQCQNAADAAALVGCRTLNNKPGAVNNDLTAAVANAKSTTTGNVHLSRNFTAAQIQKIESGQYQYDTTSQQFRVNSWTNVTNSQSAAPPSSGSWTAIRTTLSVTQPTYFMRVLGVTSMPSGARATAVYRPRDIAFVLDMTGSMAYASTFNASGSSLNPDTLVPSFGHYTSVQSNLIASVPETNGSGEAISRNNYTIATPGGPPIVRNFYFDPSNVSNPSSVAYPVTVSGGAVSLKNAFHRWSPPESNADSTTYTPPTYDFTGYNAYHNGTETNPKGPTPAPDNFGTMTDSGGITYVGDRWRRADGSINKSNASWSTSNVATKAATTAIELLGYNVSGSNVRGGTGSTTITTVDKFRDKVWEDNGYDLNIVQYRADKANGNPKNPSAYTAPLVPVADKFKGFSMGPGYYGKTFYVWPPDPRDPVGDPGAGNYKAGDWRQRYFLNRNNGAFSPDADNNSNTSSSNYESINEVLLNSGSGNTLAPSTSSSTYPYQVNYTAVLKWIKSGPQVLPPNLRAGRVLYYSSIPDDVNTGSGSTQQKLDKAFWKNYIDYVLGAGYYAYYGYVYNYYGYGLAQLYGFADSWSAAGRSIYTSNMNVWTGPTGYNWSSSRPYMNYNDSPNRPRLHFWFGPLSMMDFMSVTGENWIPGTANEAQCWQLKAGMNSVLDDVRNNHPNDHVGLVMFANTAYNGIRRPLGQNFTSLKNALVYPKSLLNAIDGGDVGSEVRPYDTGFNSVSGDEIPNASGGTDPNTGLAYAFNLLSPSASLPAGTYGARGRKGASKIVIFETDGVPNAYRGLSSSTQTMNPTAKGYDTFYPDSTWSSSGLSNGDATCISEAVKVVRQMVKPMAATNSNGTDSGLSLPNAPTRVYPIAFGDLFDAQLAPAAVFRPTALQFMATIAYEGKTGQSGATTLPSNQIITGTYTQRIDRLKDCMERIFQSGVAVTLIE